MAADGNSDLHLAHRYAEGDQGLLPSVNWATKPTGTRPRAFASMLCALAHSRIWVVFRPLPGRGYYGLACGRCFRPGGQH